MYEIKKQIEMSNIAIKTLMWYKKDYQTITNSLFINLEEEKKEKLANYIKILCMSSTLKTIETQIPIEYEITNNYKNFTIFEISNMCEMIIALLLTLELSIVKSKELKTDLRLKLIEELINSIETNNKELARVCHRAVTKIIEKD